MMRQTCHEHSLWMRPTDAPNSIFIGITTLHVSGSLSAHHQEFLAVHRHWYILCNCDEPFATRSRMELQFHPAPGSKRSSNPHTIYQCRCTAKNSWWWAERLPETCRVVIPIKLEFGASVGFIHKEFVTMHGHTILKFSATNTFSFPSHLQNMLHITWFMAIMTSPHSSVINYENGRW